MRPGSLVAFGTKQAGRCSGPCRGECARKEELQVSAKLVPNAFLPPSHWCFCPVRRQDQFPSLGMRPGFHLDLSELWGTWGEEEGETPQEWGGDLLP